MMQEQARPTRQYPALDAIPRHARKPGLAGRALAFAYVARTTTAAGVLVAAAAGLAAVMYSGSAPLETTATASVGQSVPAAAMAVPAAEKDPRAEEAKTTTPPAELSFPVPAGTGTDAGAKKGAAEATPPAGASPLADIPEVDLSVLARKPAGPVSGEEGAPAPRNPDAPFHLPTAGVPGDAEIAEFFRQPEEAARPVASPVEDLSPSVALPDPAPAPAARPTAKEDASAKAVLFRLVQGKGKKSGFWLGNRKDPNARRYFLVATVERGDGAGAEWTFENVADGKKVTAGTLAVEVPEKVFRAMSDEYAKNGRIAQDVLGSATAGDVSWKVETVGGNMMAGWNLEKGR